MTVVEEGRREADADVIERVAIALRNEEWGEEGSWQDAGQSDREYWLKSARAAIAALSTPVASQGDEVREALVEDAAPFADAASHYSAAQIEEMESRVEHLRKEIHRCDAAIEGGDSDPWWREDRSRLQQRLDDLSVAIAALGAPHEG